MRRAALVLVVALVALAAWNTFDWQHDLHRYRAARARVVHAAQATPGCDTECVRGRVDGWDDSHQRPGFWLR
jgi:hypothetical protein